VHVIFSTGQSVSLTRPTAFFCVFVGEVADVIVVRTWRAREVRVAWDGGERSSSKHLSLVVVIVVDGGRVAEWRDVLCLHQRLRSIQRHQSEEERALRRGS
jgi:hypothetical protein